MVSVANTQYLTQSNMMLGLNAIHNSTIFYDALDI
jgi:hypothetical protein